MFRFGAMCGVVSLCLISAAVFGQDTPSQTEIISGDHSGRVWADVSKHFPDRATATAKVLEDEADLLRVRHFPKDALSFYQAVLSRFGETTALLNKVGMTHIELSNVVLAESYFRRALKQDKRNWEAWNNLAAIAYLQRQYGEAENGYKKAIKLNRNNAVAHVNLSTVYFELKRYDKAIQEAREAVSVDANAFKHGAGLLVAPHALPAAERMRAFYEMAKIFAQHGREAEMLSELAKAQENGMDLLAAMSKDISLAKYVADPRVAALVHSTNTLVPTDTANLLKVSSVNSGMAPLAARR